MDRTGWIGVILCSLALVGWFMFGAQRPPARAPQAPGVVQGPGGSATGSPTKSGPATPTGDASTVAPVAGADTPSGEKEAPAEEKTVVLRSELAEFTFTSIGGGVKTAKLFDHKTSHELDENIEINEYGLSPIGAISRGGGTVQNLDYQIVEQSDTAVTFEATTNDNLIIRKRYELTTGQEDGNGYTLDLDVTIKNGDPARAFPADNLYLFTGTTVPSQTKEHSIQRGLIYYRDGKAKFRHSDFFKKEKNVNFEEATEAMQWAGVENQFFATLIAADAPYDGRVWGRRTLVSLDHGESEAGVTVDDYAVQGAMGLPQKSIAGGASETFGYRIYVGPKSHAILRDMGNDLGDAMRYNDLPLLGWIAAPFSKILISLLNLFYGWFHNYGIAIIMVTLVIRIVIWPLHNKSQRMMKRMALLGPKMTELREKYKDEPQKQQQELMKLYRDYGVNPIGGCFPMLLQMPIFLGYFQMLRSAVDLRHQGFLWVDDLSMPDTVAHVPGTDWPINILPILMGITMVLQMRMTPKTGDKTQQRIFMFMPLIFLIFCYNFASALALYWTAQNIISMGQTWLAKRQPDPVLTKKKRAAPAQPAAAPGQKTKKPKKRTPRPGG